MSVMTVATATGRFVWHDLRTTDFGRAIAFYTELFGWRIAPVATASGKTTHVFSHDGREFGGVSQLTADRDGSPSHWLCSISVPDVDDAARTAVRLGGRVVIPTYDAGGGSASVLADPTGARFALSQSQTQSRSRSLSAGADEPTGAEPGPTASGGICWHTLATADPGDMATFYADVVGWEVEPSAAPGPQQAVFTSGDEWHAGLLRKPQEVPASTWAIFFRVAQVDAAVDKVKRLGGSQVLDIVTLPDADRICGVADPTGAHFVLYEPLPE